MSKLDFSRKARKKFINTLMSMMSQLGYILTPFCHELIYCLWKKKKTLSGTLCAANSSKVNMQQ